MYWVSHTYRSRNKTKEKSDVLKMSIVQLSGWMVLAMRCDAVIALNLLYKLARETPHLSENQLRFEFSFQLVRLARTGKSPRFCMIGATTKVHHVDAIARNAMQSGEKGEGRESKGSLPLMKYPRGNQSLNIKRIQFTRGRVE